jgi:uncharacterized OB-fold protein
MPGKKAQPGNRTQPKKMHEIRMKGGIAKKASSRRKEETRFVGKPATVRQTEPATVVEWPRMLTHVHTYGMLSPFFEGLRRGELRATFCPNDRCDEKRLWIPPRGHCPDCHTEMLWKTLPNPVTGTVHTFTQVVYAGTGIELSTPYWQVDVEIPGLATLPKSYLLRGKPFIGMKVRAEFRTKKPTNTVLDYYWVPLES